jgi:hypothetical protein
MKWFIDPMKGTGSVEKVFMHSDSKIDNRARSSVGGNDSSEVDYLVHQFGMKRDQARELIKHHGNNRAVLVKYAKILFSRASPRRVKA